MDIAAPVPANMRVLTVAALIARLMPTAVLAAAEAEAVVAATLAPMAPPARVPPLTVL